ncbi:hypothetical protein RchiOBHm_Chr4g0385611 [Rosa chinensis]|uniref:Uncharacterized protein n=1 Tax=Rosa chinensis TaxID=74649 RepID=A0A2P6QNZ4_ROSCH|nr:hypothetical protein RchiOBHm_Chr4g0385611 [Rosa chinensis]
MKNFAIKRPITSFTEPFEKRFLILFWRAWNDLLRFGANGCIGRDSLELDARCIGVPLLDPEDCPLLGTLWRCSLSHCACLELRIAC